MKNKREFAGITKNLFKPFYLATLKPKKAIGKLIVTFWLLGHIALILIFLVIILINAFSLFEKVNNSFLTANDYGRIIRENYPEYRDSELTNEELGNRYLSKYSKDAKKETTIKHKVTGREIIVDVNALSEFGITDYNSMLLDINTNWQDNVIYIILTTAGLAILLIVSNLFGMTLYKIWD